MEIIAIKGIKTKSLRRFTTLWWPIYGVAQNHGRWLLLFVTKCDDQCTARRFAELLSVELEKLVIYINSKSGKLDEFTIIDCGIVCPASRAEAQTSGKHESWLIENRLSDWQVSQEDQDNIREVLEEFNPDPDGPIIYLDIFNSRVNRLATVLFPAWKLPSVWSLDGIEQIAGAKDCETI